MLFLSFSLLLYITKLLVNKWMGVYRHVPYLKIISASLPSLLLSLVVVMSRVARISLSVQVRAMLRPSRNLMILI
jgi:hypothetical protein